jgi:hypothetical protein
MAEVVDRVLDGFDPGHIDAAMTLDTVMLADHMAREAARKTIKQITG